MVELFHGLLLGAFKEGLDVLQISSGKELLQHWVY